MDHWKKEVSDDAVLYLLNEDADNVHS